MALWVSFALVGKGMESDAWGWRRRTEASNEEGTSGGCHHNPKMWVSDRGRSQCDGNRWKRGMEWTQVGEPLYFPFLSLSSGKTRNGKWRKGRWMDGMVICFFVIPFAFHFLFYYNSICIYYGILLIPIFCRLYLFILVFLYFFFPFSLVFTIHFYL